MNIGVFAYGRAGCKIADQINRFDSRTKHSMCAFTMAADTASEQLLELEYIDEDWLIVYGKTYFGGTGSKGDIQQSSKAVQETERYIGQAVNSVPRKKMDAFLVLGSFGGGTGAIGAAYCARVLKETVPGIPTYGVGVLPSEHEPDVYKVNAARSIQSFSREMNTTFVFDNKHLKACIPTHHPTVDAALPHDAMFGRVNQGIARCIHKLFTADEVSTSERLAESTLQTNTLLNALSSGGLSAFSYVSDSGAQPGWLSPLSWLRKTGHRLSKQIPNYVITAASDRSQQSEHTHTGTDSPFDPDGDPDSHAHTHVFTAPEHASFRTHPSPSHVDIDLPTVQQETGTEIILSDGTQIRTDVLPQIDRGSRSDADSDRQEASRQKSINPLDIAPLTLDENSAMLAFPPTEANTRLSLLISPDAKLTPSHLDAMEEWAAGTTKAVNTVAKAYPSGSGGVGILTVSADIGVPKRVQELQQYAERAVQSSANSGVTGTGNREYNAFDSAETTVPPVL